jgi:hypothetical protein
MRTKGALDCSPHRVLSYAALKASLVGQGIVSAGGLDAALAELVALGYLYEPLQGWFAFAVSDEELETAIAAEPVAEVAA